jgi:hypothetical protein
MFMNTREDCSCEIVYAIYVAQRNFPLLLHLGKAEMINQPQMELQAASHCNKKREMLFLRDDHHNRRQ